MLSESGQKDPPLIYLEGGPGPSGIDALEEDRLGELLDDVLVTRDVVYFDQRGTGDPDSKLQCWLFHDFPLVPAPSVAERAEVAKQLSADCAHRLRRRSVDLVPYNINESADDVAELAKHLGADKIVLVGASYGSQLAAAVIRRHGSLIDRAILAGVTSPGSNFRLPRQVDDVLVSLDAIAADPASNWPLRDPPSVAVKSLLQQFDEPKIATRTDEYGWKIDIEIARYDAERVLFSAIGSTAHWQSLPSIVAAIQQGDWSSLIKTAFLWRRVASPGSLSAAIKCSMWANDERLMQIEMQADESIVTNSSNYPYPDVCEAWDIEPLPDGDRAPLESDVAVLMVSGELDAKTPPINAIELAKGLPNATHLQIDGMGHSLAEAYSEINEVRFSILRFLDGKSVPSARHSLRFRFESLDGPSN